MLLNITRFFFPVHACMPLPVLPLTVQLMTVGAPVVTSAAWRMPPDTFCENTQFTHNVLPPSTAPPDWPPWFPRKRQFTTVGGVPSLPVMTRPPSPVGETLFWNRQFLMTGCPAH